MISGEILRPLEEESMSILEDSQDSSCEVAEGRPEYDERALEEETDSDDEDEHNLVASKEVATRGAW